ncbi:MAG: tetratricopeptide repeat protein [Candidatus Schekmanbacteria bacterium]|nr:tetratricopeptide repeat protein [Candidatus Schekmanbacteria bacterium]
MSRLQEMDHWGRVIQSLEALAGDTAAPAEVSAGAVARLEADILTACATGAACPADRLLACAFRLVDGPASGTAPASRARMALASARMLARCGHAAAASAVLERLATMAKGERLARVELVALMELADLYRRQGKLAEAEVVYDSAGERAAREGHLREHADALNGRATVLLEGGHVARADALLRHALEIAVEIDDARLTGHIYNNLGVLCCIRGDYAAGACELARALAARQSVGNAGAFAETYHNLGLAARRRQRPDEAREHLRRASEYARMSGDGRLAGNVFLAETELDLDSGDLRLARFHAERALAIHREHGDALGIAEARRFTGLVAHLQGDANEACRILEEALAAFEKVGHLLGIAETAEDLAHVARTLGDRERAQALLAQAAAIFGELGDTRRAASAAAQAASPGCA